MNTTVIPALRLPAKAGAQDKLAEGQAGTQTVQTNVASRRSSWCWVPAFAGMTMRGVA